MLLALIACNSLYFIIAFISREDDVLIGHIITTVITLLAGYPLSIYTLSLQNEIAKKSKELEDQNAQKSKLLSKISHDLRHPLISLSGILDLSVENHIGPDEFMNFIELIKKQLDSTNNTINGTLEWISHLNITSIRKLEEIDLLQLVNEHFIDHKKWLEEKSLRFSVELNHTATFISDKRMVGIIFKNLLSNAIKYTPKGGEITVNSLCTDYEITFTVRDTGIGISSENVRSLLNLSKIPSTLGTDNEKGYGLGLETCFNLIQQNEGTFYVSSQKGKGSAFSVSFPVHKGHLVY